MGFLENLQNAVNSTSMLEWLAVLSGVIYLICISLKWIIAWAFSVFSSILYVYLFYVSQLYMETGLQIFFICLAIYGWYMWAHQTPEPVPLIHAEDTIDMSLVPLQTPIVRKDNRFHLIFISICVIISVLLGYIFDHFTNQLNPYTDSFSTVFSIMATYLAIHKVLENWLYWIVIDLIGIYLFSSRELYLTSLLFMIYTLIAIFGYFKWRRLYRMQS